MKKIVGALLVICVLAGAIDGLKTEEAVPQNTQTKQSAAYQTRTYPNQHSHTPGTQTLDSYPCVLCSGSGRIECRVCDGTGVNSIYKDLSPVMKGFSKPYCEGCDGNGWITCGRCHGTGQD